MQSLSALLKSCPEPFGSLARFIDSNLAGSNAGISIPAALTLMATLKCGRVVSKSGVHPNIYTCVVAGSGTGKTKSQNVINSILNECGLMHLRCGVPTSDSGLCKRLAESNRQLILWDEFGAELESLAMSKSGFERRILKAMMELYSVAGLVYIGKQYATQDRVDVIAPYLNAFCGTTAIRFFSSLNEKFLHDGFLSRFIMFFPEAQIDKKEPSVPKFNLPEGIREYLESIEEWTPSGSGNLSMILGKQVKELRFDSVATKDTHRRIVTDFDRKLKGFSSDSVERVFYARAVENYTKVVAAICDRDVADVDSICWACDLIECTITAALEKCIEHVRPSDEEAVKERFLSFVPVGFKVSKDQLTRKSWRLRLNTRARDELIETFVEAGMWEKLFESTPGSQKKTTFYIRK